MQTIELTANVSENHTLSAHVPEEIPPGEYRVTMTVNSVLLDRNPDKTKRFSDGLLLLPIGPVNPDLTYRREEMYDDEGR